MESTRSLTFNITRQDPELIRPAQPTPHEVKLLSDIDDQESLRFLVPRIQFYPKSPFVEGKDPVKVIREAIAKALVYYYPFAGRLREQASRKLVVDCTGEGVMFIEADADVTLKEFGDALQPPFPCFEELLYDVPGSDELLNCPLFLIQVTRLKCGGFILAIRYNHTMSDGTGMSQFLSAVGEIARGAETPSIQPIWERHVLNAQDPPRATCMHREYDNIVPDQKGILGDMVHRSFFFGAAEISALRRHLPFKLQSCTTFELLTACLWRCRTVAISPDPEEDVRLVCVVNARSILNPPIPAGYYGNVLAFPVAISKSRDLCERPLHYAVDLMKEAKACVTEEYMKSLADLMVMRGRPHFAMVRSFLVSDVTHIRSREVDFGWGKAVYAGPAGAGVGMIPDIASFYIPFKNMKGEEGRIVPVCLPVDAMKVFVKELEIMLSNP